MSFDYAELATTAADVLAEFGQSLTLTKVTAPGTYDPAQSAVTGATTTNYTIKGVLFDIQDGKKTIRGQAVLAQDKQVILAATGAVPNVGDSITAGGVKYNILTFGEINPAGTVVAYDLHVRR